MIANEKQQQIEMKMFSALCVMAKAGEGESAAFSPSLLEKFKENWKPLHPHDDRRLLIRDENIVAAGDLAASPSTAYVFYVNWFLMCAKKCLF